MIGYVTTSKRERERGGKERRERMFALVFTSWL
jgi:hypothetical protein